MSVTVAEAAELYGQCKMWELKGVEELKHLSLDQMAAGYNGIGADWMPEALVKKITKYFSVFEPAAFIHDMEYAYDDDRSRDAFKNANRRFLVNCLACLYKLYCLTDKRLWGGIPKAWALYRCVRDFGWKAWEQGGK